MRSHSARFSWARNRAAPGAARRVKVPPEGPAENFRGWARRATSGPAISFQRNTRVGSLKPAQIDGSEDREVILKTTQQELKFTGRNYLVFFALPNFYFHVTTAYDILRHNGVPIGKLDFMGAAQGLPQG